MRVGRDIPDWVASYVGIPFAPRGRDRRDGLDCWGLYRRIQAERFGVLLPSLADVYSGTDREDLGSIGSLISLQRGGGHWQRVEHGDVQIGDLAEFRIDGESGHVGMVVSQNEVLHAWRGTDSCIIRIDRDSGSWAKRLVGIWRYAGPVVISGRPMALRQDRIEVTLPAGETIDTMLHAAGIHQRRFLRVFLGDREVPREAWGRVKPKAGRMLTVSAVPEGGGNGGKTALRIIATIAVVAISVGVPYLGALAGTAYAAGTLGGALLSAGIGLAGTLAINALIRPPGATISGASGPSTSPTITGTRNQLRPFTPVPLPLGIYRFAPPYAAKPYTEIVGDNTYLRCAFLLGYGPLDITEPKIGETPLSEFKDVEYEVRQGYPTDEPLRLYPNTVLQDEFAILLKNSDSWVVRRSRVDAEELSVDVAWPTGLFKANADGSKGLANVSLEIEYAPAGATDWRSANDASADVARQMDLYFREPEATRGMPEFRTLGENIEWGGGYARARPSYLPSLEYAWEAKGYIYAPQAGTYVFGLDGSDAVDFTIDGKTLITWYGEHATAGGASPDYTTHQASVTLTKGYHAYAVRVHATTSAGAVALGWQPPGAGSITTIPGTSLFFSLPDGSSGDRNGLIVNWFRTFDYSGAIVASSDEAQPLRKNLAWAVPKGQYDVRIRRATPDSTDESVFDQVYWQSLRTIRSGSPVRLKNVALVALRIRATDQLQNVIDEFNCKVQSILPDWDRTTKTWITRGTSNVASCYRAVVQGPSNKRPLPDARLDLTELAALAEESEDRGLFFNGIIDFKGTVYQRLSDICAAGRATPGVRDGLFSVVRDRPQTVPRQHITPRNSRGFKMSRPLPDRPHALRMGFFNPATGYQRDERIVLADGYQLDGLDAFGNPAPSLPGATKFETMDLFGCTSADEAWKHGRYHMAALELRPDVYQVSMAAEHLANNRGDLVLLTHDVIEAGLGFGRIIKLILDADNNLHAVELDQQVTMDAADTYAIRVRLSTGETWIRNVKSADGVFNELELISPVSPSDPRPDVGDLVMFGRPGHESRECIITAIEPDSSLDAKITLVDHAPAIHDADKGTIPPFDSDISAPPLYENRPETPVIESIRSDDYVMVRGSDGTLQPRMLITLRRPSSNRPLGVIAQVSLRRKPPAPAEAFGPYTTLPQVPITSNTVSVQPVEEGQTYQIRLRTISAIGQASNWVSAEHTVVGKTGLPPDVEAFSVVRLSDGTRQYSWNIGSIVPPDIAGVRIRFGPIWQTWEQMGPLHEGILQASPAELNDPPEGIWGFAIKAVDTSGNESKNPTYATATLGPPRLDNVAFSEDAGFDGWPGTKTDCFVSTNGVLEAIDDSTWDTIASFGAGTWDAWARWNLRPRSPIVYTHTALDAGFVFTFSPEALASTEGDTVVEVAWSLDNVTYTDWAEVSTVRGVSVTARYLKARVTVTTSGSVTVPLIKGLLVVMRAVVVEQDIQDMDTAGTSPPWRLGVGDVRLPITPGRFSVVRTIAVTFNGSGPGWSWEIVDKNTTFGPRVRLYNANHEPADAIIDAVVRGL